MKALRKSDITRTNLEKHGTMITASTPDLKSSVTLINKNGVVSYKTDSFDRKKTTFRIVNHSSTASVKKGLVIDHT